MQLELTKYSPERFHYVFAIDTLPQTPGEISISIKVESAYCGKRTDTGNRSGGVQGVASIETGI